MTRWLKNERIRKECRCKDEREVNWNLSVDEVMDGGTGKDPRV